MPLYLKNVNAVFLHIPKTGGTWFRHAAKESGIEFEELGTLVHGNVNQITSTLDLDPDWFDDKYIITIVRHPITWYQSRWCFRVKYGWSADHPLDYNCASNDFRVFVDNALKYRPSGWVTWLYSHYNEHKTHSADFIARTENIVDDLVKCLNDLGVSYNENKFRNCKQLNDSRMDGKSSRYWAKYTDSLFDRVIAVESDCIMKYYSNFQVDRSDFVGGYLDA